MKLSMVCLSIYAIYLIFSITTLFAADVGQGRDASGNTNVGDKVIIHGCDGTEWVSSTGIAPKGQAELPGNWFGHEGNGPGDWDVSFTADSMFEISGPGGEWYAFDSNQDPKHLNLYIKQSHNPAYIGQTSFVVYRIDGNTLTYAAPDPGVTTRPSSLVAGNGARVFVAAKKQ